MLFLYILITGVVGYLLGCFNGAIIISKHFFRKDIRNYGSGNAGLTNFYRTFGGLPTLLVLAIDLLKGVLGAALGRILLGLLGHGDVGAVLGMLFTMFGHCFPVFYGFQGGKGILCAAGGLIVIDPLVFAAAILLFLLVVLLTRYVSLGSLLAAVSVPFSVYFFCGRSWVAAVLGVCAAVLTTYLHRANIQRLVSGCESRFSFRKKDK